MRVKWLLILCAFLLFCGVSCTINQAQEPTEVIAGTVGLSEADARETLDNPRAETNVNAAVNDDANTVMDENAHNEVNDSTDDETNDEVNTAPDDEQMNTESGEPGDETAESVSGIDSFPSENSPDDEANNVEDIKVRDPYPSEYKTEPGFANLPNDKLSWYYNRNSEHQPPTAQRDFDIRVYDAYYLGDITRKIVYLTFDEGYENGYTGPILDILREKGVHATFFMTQTFIRDNPALSKRIAEEGHVAANHSITHRSFPDLTDDEIAHELNETARYYEETTGYAMSPFFRPPAGEYSVRSLAQTQQNGFVTIFWSFAHVDWPLDDQPGKEVTYNRVMDNLHNGGIMLLHAVSQSNTEALPDIIDAIHEQGYTFGSLYDLP